MRMTLAGVLCAAALSTALPSLGQERFSGALASADDGNLPAGAIDGDPATRWSCKGIGCWIRLALPAEGVLSGVQIAWYRGDARSSRFVVATSRDGVAWVNVLTAASSGTTAGFESYRFAPVRARYLKLTVNGNFVKGSLVGEWASITEIAPGAGPRGRDPNGVWQLYPTRAQGALPWTLGFDAWRERSAQLGTVSGAGALTQLDVSGQVRVTVKAVAPPAPASGTLECEGIVDHGTALAQGYMCSPLDWTNFEMTGYFQLVTPAADPADHDWVLYGNGGRHTGSGPAIGCLGSSYKTSYDYATGQVRMSKEPWHVDYDQRPWHLGLAGGISYVPPQASRWLGMKLVRYEIVRNGKRGVRLELWLDTAGIGANGQPANRWQIADVVEDHPDAGSWGHDDTRCNAPRDDQVLLWGGPWVTWRSDNTTSRLRLLSVREIAPPAPVPAWGQ
jgi:hypothetical protein